MKNVKAKTKQKQRQRTKKSDKKLKFYRDIVIFAAAIAVAVVITRSEGFRSLLLQLTPLSVVAELIAGGLYTSFLTVPISFSLLSVIAEHSNIYYIAAVGGVGATIGDYIIMRLIIHARQNMPISQPAKYSRVGKSMPIQIALTIVGLLCLATPVPDEIAMGILGITKIRLSAFIMLVYPAKSLGILGVLLSLQAVA